MDQVIKACLRRCWGVKYRTLVEHHISNEMLRRAAGWPTTQHMVMKASLIWLGHVARMSVNRRPKQMLFGWWKGRQMRVNTWSGQARWLERCLAYARIPSGDWFRLAQNRAEWRKRINSVFPDKQLTVPDKRRLDAWRPGLPLPDNSPAIGDRSPGVPDRVAGRFRCCVCGLTFEHGNTRQAHYDQEHAVCNPELVTTHAFQCTHCLEWFPKLEARRSHICPAREPLDRLSKVDVDLEDVPMEAHGDERELEHRHIYTDGSGAYGSAGWAAIVYPIEPTRPIPPDYFLYGPVLTYAWDPNYLGADHKSNNTGELTAIGEACLWLKEQGQEIDEQGRVVQATIHYDSQYARDIAVRVAHPRTNVALAEKVAALVEEVRAIRPLKFKHVKGHSGDIGNDCADKYADRGAAGRSSPQWKRWTEVPPAWEVIQQRDPRLIEVCRHCGRRFYDAQTRGSHEGHCNIPGVALDPTKGRCRKCGLELQKRSVKSHERLCRGDRDTNNTCRHCGRQIADLRLLRVHEFDCKRLIDWRAAKAAAPPPVPVVYQMLPHQAARGQCYKCGFQTTVRNLPGHVNHCKGSELANRTCSNCGRVYANYDSCRNHQRKCRV